MSNVRVSLLADLLEGAQKHTLEIAASVPESHRLKQLQEGKATPLWCVGHLANTINAIVLVYTLEEASLMSKEQSVLFSPDFIGGKAPTGNADDYPGWDEVIEIYNTVFAKALAGIRNLDDDVLGNPLPGKIPEDFRAFFSSIGATLGIMINHDAYHRGQIGMIAKLD
ncbi:MAG: DinB family protein [Candidatus Hydrogenedentes bacterium]|nr:DinB family protein [Candidatus Hydrogenedentota bacterium]